MSNVYALLLLAASMLVMTTAAYAQWTPFSVPGSAPQFCYINGWYVAATEQGVFRTRTLTEWKSWVPAQNSPDKLTSLAVWRGVLYAIRGKNIYRSTDEGVTWALCEAWPVATGVVRMISTESALFLQRTSDVIRSFDEGSTWDTLALPKHDTAIIPTGPDLCLLHDGWGYYQRNGLWRTSDHGTTWQRLPDGLPGYFTTLWAGPSGRVYAFGSGYGFFEFSPDFYVSYDHGATFTDQNTDALYEPFCVAEIGSSTYFCGATGGSNFLLGDWYELGTWQLWYDASWKHTSGSPGDHEVVSLVTVHNMLVATSESGQLYAMHEVAVSVEEDEPTSIDEQKCSPTIDRGFEVARITVPSCMGQGARAEVYTVLGQLSTTYPVHEGINEIDVPLGMLVRVVSEP